jgi:hypothetical protein
MKHLKKFILVACLAVPTWSWAAGAIAVDDDDETEEAGYGMVVGYDTREEAAKEALKECKSQGNSDCRVVARFDTCGAYAASQQYYGVGWGSTEAKAKTMALSKCAQKSCKVVVSDCE